MENISITEHAAEFSTLVVMARVSITKVQEMSFSLRKQSSQVSCVLSAFAGFMKQFPFKGKRNGPLVLPCGGVFTLSQANPVLDDVNLTELLIDLVLHQGKISFISIQVL